MQHQKSLGTAANPEVVKLLTKYQLVPEGNFPKGDAERLFYCAISGLGYMNPRVYACASGPRIANASGPNIRRKRAAT